MVSAQVGHYVFVLALLHHGDLLLDGCDVITCQRETEVLSVSVLQQPQHLLSFTDPCKPEDLLKNPNPIVKPCLVLCNFTPFAAN